LLLARASFENKEISRAVILLFSGAGLAMQKISTWTHLLHSSRAARPLIRVEGKPRRALERLREKDFSLKLFRLFVIIFLNSDEEY
jgi:hypothetical protein